MNSELRLLEARKELLVARASLQRLQAAGHIGVLRGRSRLPRSAAALLANPQARSVLVAAVAFALRRTRLMRLARLAGLVVAVGWALRAAAASRSAHLPG